MTAPVKKIVPRQLIFDEFLWEHVNYPRMHPGSTLTLYHPEDHECQTAVCFFGAIFFDGEHFYRIEDYVAEVDSWWAQWPD
jgi:hypothetical protein